MADTTALAVRSTARVITLPSRRAAPTLPPEAESNDAEVLQLHAAAANALSMALSLLRDPTGTTADLERATARACRAATLLKRACSAAHEGGAA